MKRALIYIALILLSVSCSSSVQKNSNSITVSIEPIRGIVQEIAGNDFEINVLVPAGSSPETYEPTSAQMRLLAQSTLYISIGLIDFEQNLNKSIASTMTYIQQVNLSKGVELIAGTCGHDHHGEHNHGVDPHVWSSPKNLKIMAETLYTTLSEQYPDSMKYKANYEEFVAKLELLDQQLTEQFAGASHPIYFMIYHPALTYLARDYGLTQLSIESEGKEPSAQQIKEMIDLARTHNIQHILYQRQFSQSTVEALAKELGVDAIAIDPLSNDVMGTISKISKIIAQ